MVSFKGAHFVRDIILTCVRWYLAYPLSYRQVEELMQERGVTVDHVTVKRWVLKYCPHRGRRCSTVGSALSGAAGGWMKPTFGVKGEWRYLYRAVDTCGQTIDFPSSQSSATSGRPCAS